MRETTYKSILSSIRLPFAVLLLFSAAALASVPVHSHHPASKTRLGHSSPQHHSASRAHNAATRHVAGTAVNHRSVEARRFRVSSKRTRFSAVRRGSAVSFRARGSQRRRPQVAHVATRHGRAAHRTRSVEVSSAASRRGSAPPPRLEERAATLSAAPEPAHEPVTVYHNRKVHHAPAAAPEGVPPAAAHSVPTPASLRPGPTRPTPAETGSLANVSKPLQPMTPPAEVRRVKTLAAAVTQAVLNPEPISNTVGGRLVIPPALKGSHEILIHQNVMADFDGLERVRDDADLERMRRQGMLVPLPVSSALVVDERLPGNRRFARPWTVLFLAEVARAHEQRFHTPLQVNSAVRTVEFQQRLMHSNGNAAPPSGETASPHLTGQAVDVAKHGLSMTEIAWLRGYLLPLVQQGKIDVEEEFQQSCFHVSVYRSYQPADAPRRVVPDARHSHGSALATAIP